MLHRLRFTGFNRRCAFSGRGGRARSYFTFEQVAGMSGWRLRSGFYLRLCFNRRRRWRNWDWRRWGRMFLFAFLETGDNFVLRSGNDLVVLFRILEEVGHIKERVALQAYIDESGLHSGQNLRDFTFVDVANNGLRSLALDHELDKFIVLEDRELRFLRRR
jgi:hypothetical protein